MTSHRELLSFFNLTEPPFSKEIPVDQLHLLPSVQRHLAAAQLLVDTRGIGAITGKAGTGKSCLLRLLADRLPPGLYRCFYLCHSSVGLVEFYHPPVHPVRPAAQLPTGGHVSRHQGPRAGDETTPPTSIRCCWWTRRTCSAPTSLPRSDSW